MTQSLGRRPVGPAAVADVLSQGTAGQSVLLTMAATGGASPFVTVFALGGSANLGQAISLCFTPPTRGDGAPLGILDDVDLEARVLFGVHGVAVDVRLDVLLGGRICLPASALRVDLRVARSGGAVLAAQTYRVGATAGYAAAGSTIGQRTLSAAAVAAAANADFAIPAFSKAVTVLVTPITVAGGYTLQWLDAGGAVIAAMDYPVGAAAFGAGPGPEQPNTSSQNGPRAGLPIPNRARTLRFVNPAGAVIRDFVQAIFEIQL